MESYASIVGLFGGALHHHAAITSTQGGIIGALALAGLVGGFTHCTGMCGPFVLAQLGRQLEAVPERRMSEFHRLTGALLLPYHLGRATTYVAIGATAAFVTGSVTGLTTFRWLELVLLLAAALFFLVQGLQGLGLLPRMASVGLGWWGRAVARLANRVIAPPFPPSGFALGVALGFLPCGLLYGALAAAAASANPVAGALGMAAFSAGTMPGLVATAYLGQLGIRRWRRAASYATPVIMIVNAGVLAHIALQ